MAKIILNDSGQQAGATRDLVNIYTLQDYSPGDDYVIEVASIEGGEPDHELPVQSIAKIGRFYYFATDLRFVNFPGANCVFPESNRLELKTETLPGGVRGRLEHLGRMIFESRIRSTMAEVLEELASWASRQGDRWEFPGPIVEAMKSINSFEVPEVGGES